MSSSWCKSQWLARNIQHHFEGLGWYPGSDAPRPPTAPVPKSITEKPDPIPIKTVTLSSPTAILHLEYDLDSLPPVPETLKPDEHWTRFVCISDTHRRTFPVPPGDVLLHSGDLTSTGTVQDFTRTMEWLYSLPHKVKIVIAGNHDLPLHEQWYDTNFYRWHSNNGKQPLEPILNLLKGPKARAAGIVYLQDEMYEFETRENGRTWSVYGSPWSPEFYNWAFNYDDDEAQDLISKFPKTDILLTHGPPHTVFDRTINDCQVGCPVLATRLAYLRPLLHVFGHIHEAHGGMIKVWKPAPLESAATATHPYDPRLDTPDLIPSEDDGSALKMCYTAQQAAEVENDVEEAACLERTVFVNAASWPAGPSVLRDGRKLGFGEGRFAPAVVDLKE